MDTNPYVAPQAPLDAPLLEEHPVSENEISETELIAFTGARRYPQLLMNLLEGRSRHAGFNLWAAIFGIQWYFYRKLYLFGLFSLALEIVLPVVPVWVLRSVLNVADQGIWLVTFFVFFVISRIVVGYMANMALCLKAVKVIKEIDSQNYDNEAHLRQIASAGGVSVPSLIGIYVVLGIARMI